MLRRLVNFLLLACFCCASLTAWAATPQPVGTAYKQRYVNLVAAASCLGVYLPEEGHEFDYLRSFGWEITSQRVTHGKVETNFAIAKNYYPEQKKQFYLVTFRGSASKKDWILNLRTERVNMAAQRWRRWSRWQRSP